MKLKPNKIFHSIVRWGLISESVLTLMFSRSEVPRYTFQNSLIIANSNISDRSETVGIVKFSQLNFLYKRVSFLSSFPKILGKAISS